MVDEEHLQKRLNVLEPGCGGTLAIWDLSLGLSISNFYEIQLAFLPLGYCRHVRYPIFSFSRGF
jgi:hypothetical protein